MGRRARCFGPDRAVGSAAVSTSDTASASASTISAVAAVTAPATATGAIASVSALLAWLCDIVLHADVRLVR